MGRNQSRGPVEPRDVDISLDGTAFLSIVQRDSGDLDSDEIHVIVNWNEELKRVVPMR
jgi:hypothetical protein